MRLSPTVWLLLGSAWVLFAPSAVRAQDKALLARLDRAVLAVQPQVLTWRRTLHQHPELGNREFQTAELIAQALRAMPGLEVQTGRAHTGVVGLLKGGKPGPVVALRADIDALPVTERNDLPFRSTATTTYRGQTTGVMHACGHDTHTAMLLGAAQALSSVRAELRGTIKFIFQPAEEGAPDGEDGGAELLVKEGVLDNPKVDVVFGQHISSQFPVGTICFRPGAEYAAVDKYEIVVRGKQTHGAMPWLGVDPVVTAAQIVLGIQTIVSRNVRLIDGAAVLTVGAIHGGIRENIIPEEVRMIGTIRSFDTTTQHLLHRRLREVATNIAASAGARADVQITVQYPVTYNDPALTARVRPLLAALPGSPPLREVPATTGAEDFAFYAQRVPGFFFWLGALPPGRKPTDGPHHTPDFLVDEAAFPVGVRALCALAVGYADSKK